MPQTDFREKFFGTYSCFDCVGLSFRIFLSSIYRERIPGILTTSGEERPCKVRWQCRDSQKVLELSLVLTGSISSLGERYHQHKNYFSVKSFRHKKELDEVMKWQKALEVILSSWMQGVSRAANIGHSWTDILEIYRNHFWEKNTRIQLPRN